MQLDDLEIDDAASFGHIALFEELRAIVHKSDLSFLVGERALSWNRAVFLNLAFWSDGSTGGDVLTEAAIPADVLMHVAWHHLAAKELDASTESDILGEAIASAFDLYLVGRLLGHAPESTFLETQIPALRDAGVGEGIDDDAFKAMLAACAEDPDRAFEDLRALLFDATIALAGARDVSDAASILERFDTHRFAAFLHHYELATWVLRTKHAPTRTAKSGADPKAVDAALRAAPSAVEWLRARWVSGAQT